MTTVTHVIGATVSHMPGKCTALCTQYGRTMRQVLAASCWLLCAGCSVVRTMEPLWLPADPQTAAEIAGEWRDPSDPTMRLSVKTLSDSGTLSMYAEDGKNWSAYIGRTIALGDARILEVNLATVREKDAEPTTLQGFTFFRITTTNERLRLQPLSDERVEGAAQGAGVVLSRSPGCEEEAKPSSPATGAPRADRTTTGSEVCYLTIEGDPQRVADFFRSRAAEIFDPGEPDDDEGLIRKKAE